MGLDSDDDVPEEKETALEKSLKKKIPLLANPLSDKDLRVNQALALKKAQQAPMTYIQAWELTDCMIMVLEKEDLRDFVTATAFVGSSNYHQ